MPRDIHDDGFHEIQLNGKQLVFLFMSATVVSVVIFLCGVLVGRGARTGASTVASVATTADDLADSSTSRPSSVDSTDTPEAEGALTGTEELDYFTRLEGDPADDELRMGQAPDSGRAAPDAETAVETEQAVEQPARLSAAASAPAAPSLDGAPALAAGDWAVQVAALNDKGDADVMALQWSQKGYQAYVVTPSDGTPAVYRVRIGAFKSRQEADALASKLQQEERISPWVTR